MSLDFGWEDEKPKFEKIPAGVYTVEITGALLDTTRENPRISWEFTMIMGEFDRRKLWFNQNVTTKSKYFVNRNLAPFGQKAEKPSDLADILPKLVGEKCQINLTYKPWTNPTTNETKDYAQIEINNWLADFKKTMNDPIPNETIPF